MSDKLKGKKPLMFFNFNATSKVVRSEDHMDST